ncbi:hypothetical protein VDG03_15705 [Xanthomonas campestris pv. raphani]|uniref:hypothetical protein n=2 Tax=Xanthomonas TaxID=338 RepID=UPI002B237F37|nr:hypothetical protein [Xanthomonas campestris]MEA9752434.1 hypothetical protein [Xanthomonas campestris pv. raphani]MEA9812690.1 hypothetical protein [Xanthomonas campestris pv. raphani]
MAGPKISLNKLGEYLTATPSRRKRIILDQQDPKAFIVARYSDARAEIVQFLASGMDDDSSLIESAKRLRSDRSGTDFACQDRIASAEAIENFLEASDKIQLEDLVVVPVENSSSEAMQISGVSVSIRPDAYLKDPVTGDIKGAIKLHFPKTTPLSEQAAEYVGAATKVFLQQEKRSPVVDHRKCYVVDVSTQAVYSAPKSHIRKMNDIAAACEEIDARWKRSSG